MKKLFCLLLLVAGFATVSTYAERIGPALNVPGVTLTDTQMQKIPGRLFILDIDVADSVEEFDYGQTPYDPDQEHCDIIAQNQAADMGLDTRDQSGRFVDYNEAVVDEIYAGYPDNRSSEPKEGTSGYYFTSTGDGKEHMGTYSRGLGSSTYIRNMNRSFQNTESSVTVPVTYIPPGVVSQRFVSLPTLPFFKRYHR